MRWLLAEEEDEETPTTIESPFLPPPSSAAAINSNSDGAKISAFVIRSWEDGCGACDLVGPRTSASSDKEGACIGLLLSSLLSRAVSA